MAEDALKVLIVTEQTAYFDYSTLQKGLHWAIAALVAFQILFGASMTRIMDAAEEGEVVRSSDTL